MQLELEQAKSYYDHLREENQILRIQMSSHQNDLQRCLKPGNIPSYESRVYDSASKR